MASISETVSAEQRLSTWEQPLGRMVALNWELFLYGTIFVLAVVTRFADLSARAISHDESLHALYSYKLYNGDGYRHDPLMHGPLLFEFTALMFFLFGDNNFTFRASVAIFGVALVMLPYFFRPWLGRLGALAASAMILISPAIMQYSRHVRHDIFVEVFTVLMFIGFFQYLRGRQEGDERRARRWFYVAAAAVALALSTMETSFIHGFVGFTFILFMSLLEGLSVATRRTIFFAGLGLALVLGGIILWLTVGNAPPPPADGTLNPARQVIEGLARISQQLSSNPEITHEQHVKSAWKLIQLLALVAGLVFTFSTLAPSAARRPYLLGMVRSVPRRQLGVAILLAAVIFVLLFTTFFTNPYGIVSGTWGGLSYWLRQQDVQRGGQPWYYYIFLLPMYEFLPLLVGAAGGVWFLTRRLREGRTTDPRNDAGAGDAGRRTKDERRPTRASASPGTDDGGRPLSTGGQQLSVPSASSPAPAAPWPAGQGGQAQAGQALRRPSPVEEEPPAILQRYFVALLIYWAIDVLVIYSWAGEKMPWLTVHLTLPLIFLAAWTIDRVLTGVPWRAAWAQRGALFALLLPLALVSLINLASVQPFQGKSLFDLRDTGQWLGSLVVAVLLVYALARYGRRLGGYLAGRVAFAVAVVLLALLTFRYAWMVSFINYDYVSEYLFYAHGAPDVTLAMQQIEDISRRTVGDKQIKVAYDDDSTWPLEWYFREYPNRAYYADSPNREQLDAPIVIVGSKNETKVKPFLGDRFQRFDYRLVWWPIETYKDQSPLKIWHTYLAPDWSRLQAEETTREELWAEVIENRKEFWNVLIYRRHSTPLNQWPYVHRFAMYVRKDVLNQLWDYQTGPVALPVAEAEPYAEGRREITAARALGSAGPGEGQFSAPRAMAIGPDGLLYVADSGNNRIQVLDADGNFVRAWGSAGTGQGQFQEPWGVAVSGDGRVYVTDTWNHRIQVFDAQGNFLLSWGSFVDTKGEPDGQPGVFWGPRDIVVDAEGNVYVADTGNKRVQKFTSGGEFVAQWGGGGVVPGRFEEPTGLALDAQGNLYVADTWNQRVQKLSPDGEPLAEWPIESWQSESVVNKPYLRVSPEGQVYVGDPEGYRILVFDDQGEFLMSFGQYGFDTASFTLPLGLAFDPDGALYVVDSDNSRVLKFGADSLREALQ